MKITILINDTDDHYEVDWDGDEARLEVADLLQQVGIDLKCDTAYIHTPPRWLM